MGLTPQINQSITNSMSIAQVERNSFSVSHSQAGIERNERTLHNTNSDCLIGVGDVRNAFSKHPRLPWPFQIATASCFSGNNGNGTPGSVGRSLRNDLLVAADSVTNAMSTLVRELNSGTND